MIFCLLHMASPVLVSPALPPLPQDDARCDQAEAKEIILHRDRSDAEGDLKGLSVQHDRSPREVTVDDRFEGEHYSDENPKPRLMYQMGFQEAISTYHNDD